MSAAKHADGDGEHDKDFAELNLVDQTNTDPGIPRHIPITKVVVRLGRVEHPDYADVAIKSAKFEAMVSRKHATIKKLPRGWAIIDNKSTNGVMVNKQQIQAEATIPIKDGDVITFGTEQSDLVYTFEVNRRRAGCGKQEQVDEEMQKLKKLADDGWFNKSEYDHARAQLQDRGPPSKWMAWERTPKRTTDIKGTSDSQMKGPMEKVFKYVYDFHRREWLKTIGLVTMETKPFDEGAMRLCYRMTDWTRPEGERDCVAKCAKDPEEPQHTYFVDIEMQSLCQYFSEEFNKKNPPKKVEFVDCHLIECVERPGKSLYAVEPFMKGKYTKHNNNWGFVSPEDRNTPQAFSHFTYTHSSGFFLVCDIQGVGDRYTDPQVHSKDQKGFGRGNMGLQGINRFFATHECNLVCVHLGIDTNRRKKVVDVGTKPPPNWGANRQRPGPGAGSSNAMRPGQFSLTDEELESVCLTREQLDNIVRVFQKYDKGTAAIAKTDLVPLCRDLEYKVLPADLNRVQPDSEGRIPFKTFLLWWRGVDA
jgi:pSer/pThr/pTyr-binding forkhead associated (FHA) protein